MRTITVKDLARDAKEFLLFKRSMGITYQRGEHVLDSFLRFVVKRWGNGKMELDDVVRPWEPVPYGSPTIAHKGGYVLQ
jgi:integrase/recombinase XerD